MFQFAMKLLVVTLGATSAVGASVYGRVELTLVWLWELTLVSLSMWPLVWA